MGIFKKASAILKDNEGFIIKENKNSIKPEHNSKISVSKSADVNLAKIKEFMHYPAAGDLMLRNFKVKINGEEKSAFLFFIDGLVDRTNIGHFVLNPLMHESGEIKRDIDEKEYVLQKLVSQNVVSVAKTYFDAITKVCFGECGLFIDGIDVCFLADVKGWEKRSVGKPSTEGAILGPQEGFTELIRANTAMLRKTIKDPDLVMENISVGKKSQTPCVISYITSIANPDLVAEVKERIKKIDVDYLFTSDELANFLEESNLKLMPQILLTERPDRTAMELVDGNVAILVNGSPFALIMPVTFFSFMKTTDNNYMRLPYANLLSVVRYLAMIISVVLPALFIVVTNFHHEMIPTDLLYALESSFEKTPFPTVFELVILEIAFELIREAVIKFPSIGGPSIGIVGALVLGQAAVSANIVSPIIIIIVAATAVGSLSTPNYSFGMSLRIMKFVYIFFAYFAGFIGFSACLFMHFAAMCTTKSFGVRYFSSASPKTRENALRNIFITRDYKKTSKPDYVNSKGDNDK